MTDWPEWAPSACWRRGRPERRGIGACPRPGRSSAGPSRSRPPRRPLARTSTPCSPPVHTVQYSTVQYSTALPTDISVLGWSMKSSSASWPSRDTLTLFSPYSSSERMLNGTDHNTDHCSLARKIQFSLVTEGGIVGVEEVWGLELADQRRLAHLGLAHQTHAEPGQ